MPPLRPYDQLYFPPGFDPRRDPRNYPPPPPGMIMYIGGNPPEPFFEPMPPQWEMSPLDSLRKDIKENPGLAGWLAIYEQRDLLKRGEITIEDRNRWMGNGDTEARRDSLARWNIHKSRL